MDRERESNDEDDEDEIYGEEDSSDMEDVQMQQQVPEVIVNNEVFHAEE